MRFATLPNGTKDGRLHFVSKDSSRAAPVRAATTLQAALDDWTALEPALVREYAALNAGETKESISFEPASAMAALPRAWQWLDGSCFDSHGTLMKQVFNLDAAHPLGLPLMYQGISDRFQSPAEDAPFGDAADLIDFEGEFGVITDAVPHGASAEACRSHIRLLVQVNDWSLRRLGPIEMKSGFGVIQCKPRCSMAPVAVTPDEIGTAWRDCRVGLDLDVFYNGVRFGAANGDPMSFGFNALVAHAAYSRDLVAGTVIGSGTVSNPTFRTVGSSCISERRAIELQDHGAQSTPYMQFGDRVRMEARNADGTMLFGPIEQTVVALAR